MYDPIVAEVRKIRDAHSKKFNYDLDAIVADYQTRSVEIRQRLKKIKDNFNEVISQDAHPSRP